MEERQHEEKKWTGIVEVLPGIYRIPVPLPGNPLKELNSYVIRGEGNKNLLIDTGFRLEACREALTEGFRSLQISMDDTDILLTHLHVDHTGLAPDLVRPANKVYIGEADRRFMNDVEGVHVHRVKRLEKNGIAGQLIREMLAATPSRTMAADESFNGYTCLKEGDVIEAGPYRLQAISTPGHTPGQMCFSILGTGAMILADHVLFDITPNITDWEALPDALGSYLESLDVIDKYEVTIPLPGHRQPGDFHGRIRALKEHHKRRLEECRQVIESLGRARLYDIAGNMTWKIRAAGWDDFPPAQRWFALGECLSHIDYLKKRKLIEEKEEGGQIWYEA